MISIFRSLRPSILAFLLVVGPSLHAQIVGGLISGTVTDASGAALAGASVVVHNAETGLERRLLTDAEGRYAAPSLPIGTYDVSASSEGFAPQQRTGIPLTVGQSNRVNLTLSIDQVHQEVVVEDRPAVVNLTTQQTSGLVDERQVKGLPLNGRSYDQLMTLNPATVNYSGQRTGGIGTSNSAVGNMFVISGHRPQDNLFLLNGIEYTGASLINLTPGGTSGQLLGVDAVREFNVVTDAYGASYGKRTGAQVSIVTASGTNRVHGSVFEFLRNSALDARNYFDQTKIPEFQRNQFGAALGGPLRANKIFLFGNYEGYRQNLGLSDVTLVPDAQARAGFLPNSAGVDKYVGVAPAVQPLLALWPVPNGPELLNAAGQPSGIAEAFSSPMQHIREDFGTTRFDYNLGDRDLFFAVYTIDDSSANTPTANPLSLVAETLREQVLSGQEQHVFSPRLLNTARVGFSRASYYFTGSTPVSVPGWVAGKPIGAIVIAGSTASNGASQITLAGTNVGSNNATTRNLYTLDDHIFFTRGRHQIEIGGWVQRIQANDNLAQNQYGQASFSTLASFLQGAVATFTVVPSPTELGWHSTEAAGFVDDTFKVNPRLELRAGFRFESTNGWQESQGRASNYLFTNGVIQTTPRIGNSALTNNRAKFLPEPRVGFAWDVFGNGRTAVRGGFGIHRALLDNLDYRLDQAAPFNTTQSLKNVPVSGLNITPGSTAPAGSLISPSNVQTDIQTPTVLSWTLKVEQQLSQNTSLTIGYVGSHGYHQILSEDMNEPVPTILQDGTVFYPVNSPKANPLLANTTSWVSQGVSFYNGLEVDLRRRFEHGLQFRGVYTYSKNLDDGSAWNTSVSGNTPAFVMFPLNPKLDWGPAATDVRHVAAISGSYELPFGRGKSRFANARSWQQGLIGGWTFSGIATVQSGFPFSPQLGYNPTGNGDTRNPVRPSVNPNFHGALYPGTPKQFFNPNAFIPPAAGTYGNAGRDSLTGPGLAEFDTALHKTTRVSDNLDLQLRAEIFNLFNRANFSTPNEVVYSSPTTPSATAGLITSTATTSRQIQIGIKLLF